MSEELESVAREIAGKKRPDPSRGDSNEGRWVTLTIRRSLIDRLDHALDEIDRQKRRPEINSTGANVLQGGNDA